MQDGQALPQKSSRSTGRMQVNAIKAQFREDLVLFQCVRIDRRIKLSTREQDPV